MTGLVPVTVKPRFIGFDGIKHYRIPQGASLQEIALEVSDILPPEFWTGHGVICVGDRRVPQAMWASVRPRVVEGREIAVTLNIVPYGSDQRTVGILTTIAGVAITAAGVVTAGIPGYQAIGGYIITAGIGVTLSGIGMLLAPVPPQPKDEGKARTIQAGVSENSAAPFEWLPRVLGRMVYSPPQLIRPYTVYSRRSIKVCGAVGLVGRHAVSNVRINGALASSMTNLTYETRGGAPGDTALTIGNKWVYEESPRLQLSNFDLKTDSSNRDELFDQTTPLNSYPQYQTFLTRTGTSPDKVVMRVLFPQGMVADTSDNVTLVIPIRVEFRLRGSSTWILGPEFHWYDENKGNSEIRQNLTFIWQADPGSSLASPNSSRVATVAYQATLTGYAANAYFSNGSSPYAFHVARDGSDGFIVYLNPATFPKSGHYEFRVKRGMGYRYGLFDTASYMYNGISGDFFAHYNSSGVFKVRIEQYKFRGEMQIEAFQTWHDQYPLQSALSGGVPLTLIAFEGRDMEINSVSAQFDSQVPTFNGSNWNTIASSRNPAAHYRHVLVDSLNSDPRALALVNSSGLEEWYTHCATQDYQCNAIVTANEPEVLALIASAGWAGQRSHEQFDVVIERDRSSLMITQNFTPINSSNYIASKAFADLPHAFNTEYFDDADDNKVKTEIIYALGFNAASATRFETIQANGITVRSKVQDRMRNILRTLYLRQVEHSIDIGIEALVSRRGDLVGLSHDLKKTSSVWFGTVVSVLTSGGNVTGLTLNSRALLTGVPGPFSALLRYMNQAVMTRQIVDSTDTSTITFATPFAIPANDVLRKGCLVSIGLRSAVTNRCIVSNIIYKDEFTATVKLIDEAPEIYSGVFAINGVAEGTGLAVAVGMTIGPLPMVGQAFGIGQAFAVGNVFSGTNMEGTATGAGTAQAVGASFGTVSRAGVATGAGTATANGAVVGGVDASSGAALGAGTAQAVGASLNTEGSGLATGVGSANGVSPVSVPSTTFSYINTLTDTTDKSAGQNYTFAAQNIGTAHAKRLVICGVYGTDFSASNTMTIGGVSAVSIARSGNFNLLAAAVPSGTTADFILNCVAGSMSNAVISYGVFYPDVATRLGTNVATASGVTPAIATINASAQAVGGIVIGFGGQAATLGAFTWAWSGGGADAVNEHVDAQIESTTSYTLVSINLTNATTRGLSLAPTVSGTKVLCYATWGAPPA